MMFFIHLIHYKVYLTALKNSKLKWIVYREHTVIMYSTAYNLWIFTWFVHFELPFRLNGNDKIHTEGLTKFHSNIYSILFGNTVIRAWSSLNVRFIQIINYTSLKLTIMYQVGSTFIQLSIIYQKSEFFTNL